jgi:hypothetical protein
MVDIVDNHIFLPSHLGNGRLDWFKSLSILNLLNLVSKCYFFRGEIQPIVS